MDYVSVYLFWNRIQFSEKLSVRSFDRSTIIGGSFSIKYYAGTVRSRIDVANGITRISGDFPVYGFSHFAVEVLRFCKTKKIMFKMPEQVPSSVARSFEAVIPAAIIIIVIGTINVVFKVNIEQVIQTLFSPLVKAGDTFLGS